MVTFAVGVFLGVAIVKPWGSTTRPAADDSIASPGTDGSPRIVSTGPAPSAEAVPVAATSCLSSDRQQLVVFERWPGNEVRSWIAVPDVTATGPLDQDLVSTDVFAAHATAIGVCAASVGASPTGRHAATILDVRVVLPNTRGGQPLDAGPPHEISGGGNGPDPIRLFAPPAGAIASPSSPAPRPSGATSSPNRASASTGAASSASAATTGASSRPTSSPDGSGASGTVTPDTWSLGAYTIAFRFSFDPPDAQRWLRFNLLHGGGDG